MNEWGLSLFEGHQPWFMSVLLCDANVGDRATRGEKAIRDEIHFYDDVWGCLVKAI